MAALQPCYGCTERLTCEIKKGILASIRNQPITSARIRCDLPHTKYFPPGTRVKVRVWDFRDDDPDEGSPGHFVPATVFGPSLKKRGRLVCRLDQPIQMRDEKEVTFRLAYPKDVQRLDEPRAELCRCGRPLVNGGCDNWEHNRAGRGDE